MLEFSLAGHEQSAAGGSTVTKALGHLADSAEKEATKSTSLFYVGSGLPAIPRKTAEKILAGDYVDFSDLPPTRGKAKSLPSSVEGHIIVVQAADLAQSRKLIPDLGTWSQCFAIFMAVVTAKEPDRSADLLAYLSTIAKASLKYRWPAWIVYDQNFRQEAADKGLRKWAQVDPSIYAQCFTSMSISQEGWCKTCMSIDHSSESCPLKMTWKRPTVPLPSFGNKRFQQSPKSSASSTTSMRATASLGGRAVFSTFAVRVGVGILFPGAPPSKKQTHKRVIAAGH